MTFERMTVLFILIVGGLTAGLSPLPDTIVSALFCWPVAEVSTAWLGVPLERATLTYVFGGQAFSVAPSCAALGFFSTVFALLLLRRAHWCWLAYPITLAVNALRVTTATHLTLLLHGFRYERLAHLLLGALLFLTTLLLLWTLTERNTHGTDHSALPLS